MDFSRQQYVYALLWFVKYSTIRLNRFRVILISAFCWRSSTGNSYLIYTIWINCGLLSVTTWVRAFSKFLCSTQPTFAARSSSKSQPSFWQVIVLLPLSTKPSLHSNTSVAPMLYLGSDIITVPFLSVRLPGFSHRIAENRQKYADYDFWLFRSSL